MSGSRGTSNLLSDASSRRKFHERDRYPHVFLSFLPFLAFYPSSLAQLAFGGHFCSQGLSFLSEASKLPPIRLQYEDLLQSCERKFLTLYTYTKLFFFQSLENRALSS